MDPKTAKIVSTSVVLSLVVVMAVVGRIIGPTSHIFLAVACACVATIIAAFVFLLLQFSLLDRRRRISLARRFTIDGGRQLRSDYSFLRKVAGVPVRFKHDVLASATDDFRAVVGHGSTSDVFRGVLEDGTAIAVKRLKASQNADGDGPSDRAFRSEVAAIASVQHVNLVRLLGYSDGGGHRFLVYEYIHNGSLDRWVFPRSRPQLMTGEEPTSNCLAWKLRYRVAIDVARALSYLHHDCRHRVLHLDVKPENILLDERFNACVADFGLSKLMRRDQSRVITTMRGTRGYLAPEWLLQNGITEKSDVYGYGLVLFELVSGRRNLITVEEYGRRRWSYLPCEVMEKEREGRLMEVVDDRMAGDAEEKEVRALVYVALWCVQEEPKLRPTMKAVVDMLEGRMEIERPPETEMPIMDLLTLGESGQSSRPSRLPATLQLLTPEMSTFGSVVSELTGR